MPLRELGTSAVTSREHKPPRRTRCGRLTRRNAVTTDEQNHRSDDVPHIDPFHGSFLTTWITRTAVTTRRPTSTARTPSPSA